MPLTRPAPRKSWTALVGLLVAVPLAVTPATALDSLDPPEPSEAPAARKGDRSFKVATLNVLGSNHTRGWDRRRTFRTARLIAREKIRLIALQEVQEDQYRWLAKKLPRYRMWPGTKLDRYGIRLQIAWRKSRFDKLDHGTVTTTFSHRPRPTPWVLLREERTGRRIYVVNVHNSPRNQERDRDRATRKQIRLFNELDARRGSVLMIGDANERREWFCRVTGRTTARAANGGRHRDGACRPPDPAFVDWLMGAGRFTWRSYDSQQVRVSDHPLHTAMVRWR